MLSICLIFSLSSSRSASRSSRMSRISLSSSRKRFCFSTASGQYLDLAGDVERAAVLAAPERRAQAHGLLRVVLLEVLGDAVHRLLGLLEPRGDLGLLGGQGLRVENGRVLPAVLREDGHGQEREGQEGRGQREEQCAFHFVTSEKSASYRF